MKTLRLLLLFSLPFSGIFAQCPAPDVLNWQFTGVDSVTITADFPEGVLAYELSVAGIYHNTIFPSADTLTVTDEAVPGVAVLGIDPSALVQPNHDPATAYYEATFGCSVHQEHGQNPTNFMSALFRC